NSGGRTGVLRPHAGSTIAPHRAISPRTDTRRGSSIRARYRREPERVNSVRVEGAAPSAPCSRRAPPGDHRDTWQLVTHTSLAPHRQRGADGAAPSTRPHLKLDTPTRGGRWSGRGVIAPATPARQHQGGVMQGSTFRGRRSIACWFACLVLLFALPDLARGAATTTRE